MLVPAWGAYVVKLWKVEICMHFQDLLVHFLCLVYLILFNRWGLRCLNSLVKVELEEMLPVTMMRIGANCVETTFGVVLPKLLQLLYPILSNTWGFILVAICIEVVCKTIIFKLFWDFGAKTNVLFFLMVTSCHVKMLLIYRVFFLTRPPLKSLSVGR